MDKIERIVRCARRLRGIKDADKRLLDAVEDAAKSSCRKMSALTGFRFEMVRLVMETEGHLFNFMLLWFLGGLFSCRRQQRQCMALCTVDSATLQRIALFRLKPFKEQVDEVLAGSTLMPAAMKILRTNFFLRPQNQANRNAYKEVVDENKARLSQKFPSILRELAFLEEDKTELPSPDSQAIQMKLPNPAPADLMELAKVLEDEHNGFTVLCKPKSLLTHLENFRLALLHARLWLLSSELPVCFGSNASYKDLRSKKAYESMIYERAEESFPSVIETDHMEAAVFAHSILKGTQEVYHMKQEDYLPSSRWNRPGYPVIITRGNKESSCEFLSWREGLQDDDDVKQTVRAFGTQETPRVLAQLRKFNSKSFQRFGSDF